MSTMTKYDFKAKATDAISKARTFYLDDLAALSEDQLLKSPGGCARTPADFTYELVVINRRITMRLKGQDPGPYPFEGWITAPAEYTNKEAIIRDFDSSTKELEEALAAIPEDEMLRTIQLPNDTTTPYDLVTFCATHIGYHDAQLNFLQTLHDDKEVHWKFD